MFSRSNLVSSLVSKVSPANRQKLLLAGIFGCVSVVSSIFVVSVPEKAEACRDCPFPMKVGDNVWLMPNRQLEVQIVEVHLTGGLTETRVQVINAESRAVLASGSVRQRRGRRTANVVLDDSSGTTALAEIHWMDTARERVQIELSCGKIGECSLSQFLN